MIRHGLCLDGARPTVEELPSQIEAQFHGLWVFMFPGGPRDSRASGPGRPSPQPGRATGPPAVPARTTIAGVRVLPGCRNGAAGRTEPACHRPRRHRTGRPIAVTCGLPSHLSKGVPSHSQAAPPLLVACLSESCLLFPRHFPDRADAWAHRIWGRWPPGPTPAGGTRPRRGSPSGSTTMATSPPLSSRSQTSAWSAVRPGCATGTPRDRATLVECRVSSST